jgi:hypothetical protein
LLQALSSSLEAGSVENVSFLERESAKRIGGVLPAQRRSFTMPRPEPSFPIRFELFKPTRFSKEESVMYFAHEWDACQKSLHHDDQPATTPAKAVPSPATKAAVTPEINQAPTENTAPAPPIAPAAISTRSKATLFALANRTSIYRHAHCTGLFAWRRRELGRVLEGMLENHEHIPLEASDAIVRAARVYAHLDENGNWFEPARINFVLTGPAPAISRPEPFQLTHEFQTKNEISKRRAKSRTPRSRRRGIVASKQNRVRRSPITSRRPSSNRNSRFTEKSSSK